MDIRSISIEELPSLKDGARLFSSREWASLYPRGLQAFAMIDAKGRRQASFTVFVKEKWGMSYCITPPFAPHIGLDYTLTAEKTVGQQSQSKDIHKQLADWVKGRSDILLELALSTDEVDSQPYTWSGLDVKPRHTYLIDLSQTAEDIMAGMSPERRKNIKKAQGDGLMVERVGDVPRFKKLIMKTLDRQGLKVDMDIFDSLLAHAALAEYRGLYVCSKDGVDMAASLLVWDAHRAYYLIGAYDPEHAHEGAGTLNLWQAIQDAKGRGNAIFDFEGSMIPEVERYFRGFGGELHTYFEVRRASRLGRLLKAIK